jgi:hypothetical protein
MAEKIYASFFNGEREIFTLASLEWSDDSDCESDED